jgi:hypothetical protein
MLKNGEMKLAEIDDDLRKTHLEIDELNRRIRQAKEHAFGRKQVGIRSIECRYVKFVQIEAVKDEVAEMTAKIAERRQHIAELNEKLESPSACERHRVIPGEDPDFNQLNSKIEVLQDILNDKKEQLLEKDLVLEEVGIRLLDMA